jgi:hypothetical protein
MIVSRMTLALVLATASPALADTTVVLAAKNCDVPTVVSPRAPARVPPAKPVTRNASTGSRLKTVSERQFTDSRAFQTALLRGRLVEDAEGRVKFDNGQVFVFAKTDPVSGHPTRDTTVENVTKPYWGDWAYCRETSAAEHLFECKVIHHDVIADLDTTARKKAPRS